MMNSKSSLFKEDESKKDAKIDEDIIIDEEIIKVEKEHLNLKSLQPNEWLQDDILNNYIWYLLRAAKKTDEILLVPSFIYQTLGPKRDNFTNIVGFLQKHEALNFDSIVVIMNNDFEQGSHWTL